MIDSIQQWVSQQVNQVIHHDKAAIKTKLTDLLAKAAEGPYKEEAIAYYSPALESLVNSLDFTFDENGALRIDKKALSADARNLILLLERGGKNLDRVPDLTAQILSS